MSQFPEPDVITIVDHHDQPTPDTYNPIDTMQLYDIGGRDRLEPTTLENTIPERDSDQLAKVRRHLRAADEATVDMFKQIDDMKEVIKDMNHQLANAKKEAADTRHQPEVERGSDIDDVKQEINDVKHQLSPAKKEAINTRHQPEVERGSEIDDMKQEIQGLKLQLANAKTDTADAMNQLELERQRHDQSRLEAEGLGPSDGLVPEDQFRDAESQIGVLREEIRGLTQRAKNGADRQRLQMEGRRGQYRNLLAKLHIVTRYNSSTWDIGMAVNTMRRIVWALEEDDCRY